MNASSTGTRRAWRGMRAPAVALLAAALLLAFALKAFYAQASFDQLRWILAPTAVLAGAIGGAAFELEPHQAYLCRDARFALVPACAGLNFAIVVLLSLAAGVLPLVRGWRRAALWLVASVAIAFAATVLIGALRIGIAMRLHAAGCDADALRIEGVAVYLSGLALTYGLAMRAGERLHAAP